MDCLLHFKRSSLDTLSGGDIFYHIRPLIRVGVSFSLIDSFSFTTSQWIANLDGGLLIYFSFVMYSGKLLSVVLLSVTGGINCLDSIGARPEIDFV